MAGKKPRRRLGGRPARRWFAVAALVLVGLLYYRPLHDYLNAQGQVSVREAAEHTLLREQATLERRLRAASSPAALMREARLLGYVRPGEHLFIVKDVKARHRQNASRRGHRR